MGWLRTWLSSDGIISIELQTDRVDVVLALGCLPAPFAFSQGLGGDTDGMPARVVESPGTFVRMDASWHFSTAVPCLKFLWVLGSTIASACWRVGTVLRGRC